MHPRTLRSRILPLILATGLAVSPALHAQQDTAPIDVNQLLQALRALRDQQTTQLKAQKQTAIQQISAAAGSPEKSIQLWEDAVRATQFDGMTKEGAQFRAWKEGEGEALKERIVQNAVRLHLNWLTLTLQRSAGAKISDMLPAIVNYTKDLVADEAAMDLMAENIKREKEAAAIAPPGGGNRRNQNQPNKLSDTVIKRAHDQILRPSLAASPVVKWMRLSDAVNIQGWENNPGNLDSIFQKIILPELRQQKDARVLDYWDLKLKNEADAASRSRLAYEIEKFNTERRPTLLWNRSQEYVILGQKNRAISEMFALIKSHPSHPDADEWIGTLESLLVPPPTPPPAPSDSAAAAPGAPAAPPAPRPPGR